MFYLILRRLCYILFRILFRLKVHGKRNIPQRDGVIIASNHLSYLDPPLIGVSIKRRATFMAKAGLFKIPLLNLIIKRYSIRVDRSTTKPSTLKKAVEVIKNGGVLVIFPEGGRSKDGNLMSIKRGIGVIAGLTGAPVVPAFIKGSEKALPVGSKFIRFARIEVFFGKVLKKMPEEGNKEYGKRIVRDLMASLHGLKEMHSGEDTEG